MLLPDGLSSGKQTKPIGQHIGYTYALIHIMRRTAISYFGISTGDFSRLIASIDTTQQNQPFLIARYLSGDIPIAFLNTREK